MGLIKIVLKLFAVGIVVAVAFMLALNYSSTPTPDDSRPGGTTHSELVVLVQYGTLGLRVTNDTSDVWGPCEAQITGGYLQTRPTLPPHETVNFPYAEFSADGARLDPDQGYVRAIRGTLISCTGDDSRRHHARIQ